MQVKKQQLEMDMEKQTGSKLGKEYVKAVYCHPAYLKPSLEDPHPTQCQAGHGRSIVHTGPWALPFHWALSPPCQADRPLIRGVRGQAGFSVLQRDSCEITAKLYHVGPSDPSTEGHPEINLPAPAHQDAEVTDLIRRLPEFVSELITASVK